MPLRLLLPDAGIRPDPLPGWRILPPRLARPYALFRRLLLHRHPPNHGRHLHPLHDVHAGGVRERGLQRHPEPRVRHLREQAAAGHVPHGQCRVRLGVRQRVLRGYVRAVRGRFLVQVGDRQPLSHR